VGVLSIIWGEVGDGVAIFVIILAVASIKTCTCTNHRPCPLSDSETAEFRRLLPSDLADWRTSSNIGSLLITVEPRVMISAAGDTEYCTPLKAAPVSL
jgi:hypothetical protein